MEEIKRILEVYKQVDLSTRKAALATVVYVKGSAHRRPGHVIDRSQLVLNYLISLYSQYGKSTNSISVRI